MDRRRPHHRGRAAGGRSTAGAQRRQRSALARPATNAAPTAVPEGSSTRRPGPLRPEDVRRPGRPGDRLPRVRGWPLNAACGPCSGRRAPTRPVLAAHERGVVAARGRELLNRAGARERAPVFRVLTAFHVAGGTDRVRPGRAPRGGARRGPRRGDRLGAARRSPRAVPRAPTPLRSVEA